MVRSRPSPALGSPEWDEAGTPLRRGYSSAARRADDRASASRCVTDPHCRSHAKGRSDWLRHRALDHGLSALVASARSSPVQGSGVILNTEAGYLSRFRDALAVGPHVPRAMLQPSKPPGCRSRRWRRSTPSPPPVPPVPEPRRLGHRCPHRTSRRCPRRRRRRPRSAWAMRKGTVPKGLGRRAGV